MQTIYKLSFLLFSCFFIFSCEKEEGCLDSLSKNFDVAADINCKEDNSNCQCKYPHLNFNQLWHYDNQTYHKDSIHTNEFDQEYRIINGAIFLSNITIFENTGKKWDCNKSLTVELQNNERYCFNDDIIIMSSISNSYKNLSLRHQTGIYDSIRLQFGINDKLSKLKLSNFDLNHKFRFNDDYLNDVGNNELLNAHFSIHRIAQNDTLEIHITNVTPNIYLNFSLEERILNNIEDINLNISMDVNILFNQVNFSEAPAQWNSTINSNVLNAISIQ